MAITAAQVKELREATGAGMMDCKKALQECEGDLEAAKDWLRKNGISKAEKKEGRTAAEGLARVKVEGNKAVVVEINSETDFVAKNELFQALLDQTCDVILANCPADVEAALACPTADGTLNDSIVNAVATIGEKIKLRRFEIVEKSDDEVFGVYMHNGGNISTVDVLKGADEDIAKKIAMQIASMSPEYVSRNDMPAEVVERERSVQEALVAADPKMAGKPEKVIKGAIEGKVTKSLKDKCLVDQEFFLESDKTCGQFMKEHNTECVTFVRYKVGEGMAKREENFAEEVAKAAQAQ